MQDPHVDPRLAAPQPLAPQVRRRLRRKKLQCSLLKEVQQVPVAAPAALPAPLPTLPPAPLLEPSFNFLQDSQVTSFTYIWNMETLIEKQYFRAGTFCKRHL